MWFQDSILIGYEIQKYVILDEEHRKSISDKHVIRNVNEFVAAVAFSHHRFRFSSSHKLFNNFWLHVYQSDIVLCNTLFEKFDFSFKLGQTILSFKYKTYLFIHL